MGRSKREPVETMSRMALMQEVAEWRRIGPALKAVARAAKAAGDVVCGCPKCHPLINRLREANARLRRPDRAQGGRKP